MQEHVLGNSILLKIMELQNEPLKLQIEPIRRRRG